MTTETTNDNGTSSGTAPTSGVLQELVGNDKKFKTVDDLAKGKLESDKFISKLESENKDLRDLVAKAQGRLEEAERRASFLERVTSGHRDQSDEGSNQEPARPNPNENTTRQSALSTDDVIKLMEERERERTQKANLDTVDRALLKEFGAEAKNIVSQKADELGLPIEYLINTARTSPTAFYNLIGLQPTSNRNASLTSRVNGSQTSPASGIRNQAYYEKLKTSMGAWKFATDKSLQIQMHKDMSALGDRYFET